MPDPAKLQVLENAKYEMRETCFSCAYLELPPGWVGHPWASCRKIPSAHTKHTDGGRLSVRIDGWCPGYVATGAVGQDLYRSGFLRFVKEDSK